MSNPARVGMAGPLAEFAPAFLTDLVTKGYRPGTAAKQLQLMAHLSRWLGARELEPAALDRAEIERFVRERRLSHVHLVSVAGMQVLLGYLRGLGVVPPAGSREAPTPTGELLDRYAEYLRVRRGVKPGTVRSYWARRAAPPPWWAVGRDRIRGVLCRVPRALGARRRGADTVDAARVARAGAQALRALDAARARARHRRHRALARRAAVGVRPLHADASA